MFSLKKLPWASLMLLLITYSAFGWLLYSWTISWRFWLLMTVCTVLMSLALTAPFQLMRFCFGNLLKTDSSTFIGIIVGAFIAVIFMRWFPIFVHVLILLSAACLARLDMQVTGSSELQAFLLLAIVSLSGLWLGLLGHQQLLMQHIVR